MTNRKKEWEVRQRFSASRLLFLLLGLGAFKPLPVSSYRAADQEVGEEPAKKLG